MSGTMFKSFWLRGPIKRQWESNTEPGLSLLQKSQSSESLLAKVQHAQHTCHQASGYELTSSWLREPSRAPS